MLALDESLGPGNEFAVDAAAHVKIIQRRFARHFSRQGFHHIR